MSLNNPNSSRFLDMIEELYARPSPSSDRHRRYEAVCSALGLTTTYPGVKPVLRAMISILTSDYGPDTHLRALLSVVSSYCRDTLFDSGAWDHDSGDDDAPRVPVPVLGHESDSRNTQWVYMYEFADDLKELVKWLESSDEPARLTLEQWKEFLVKLGGGGGVQRAVNRLVRNQRSSGGEFVAKMIISCIQTHLLYSMLTLNEDTAEIALAEMECFYDRPNDTWHPCHEGAIWYAGGDPIIYNDGCALEFSPENLNGFTVAALELMRETK